MSAVPPAVPVGREERRALLTAAAGYFCLLCGYYMLRPMREALALEVGVQTTPILFSDGAACARAALLPIYWWLVGRTPRGRLLWIVWTPFVLVFLALALGLTWYPRDRTLAFVYFVALTSANLLLISVFWSAMADVWRPELAKRFYRLRGGRAAVQARCSGHLIVRGAGARVGADAAHHHGLRVHHGSAALLRLAGAPFAAAGAGRRARARWRHPGRRPRSR